MKTKIKIPRNKTAALALATKKAKRPKFKSKRYWLWWHFHHQGLVECHNAVDQRLNEIFRWKSGYELPIRVAFLNPVKRIPEWVRPAFDNFVKARKAFDKNSSNKDYHAMEQARAKLSKALNSEGKNKVKIREWHDRECGANCPYDHRFGELNFSTQD